MSGEATEIEGAVGGKAFGTSVGSFENSACNCDIFLDLLFEGNTSYCLFRNLKVNRTRMTAMAISNPSVQENLQWHMSTSLKFS